MDLWWWEEVWMRGEKESISYWGLQDPNRLVCGLHRQHSESGRVCSTYNQTLCLLWTFPYFITICTLKFGTHFFFCYRRLGGTHQIPLMASKPEVVHTALSCHPLRSKKNPHSLSLWSSVCEKCPRSCSKTAIYSQHDFV